MKKFIIGAGASLLPVFALAADFTSFESSIDSINRLINALIPVVIGIAVLLFLIGILQYVTAGGDEEKRAAARGLIIFGIIALFVMVAVWGFVRILTKTFFGNNDYTIAPGAPQVHPYRNSGGASAL